MPTPIVNEALLDEKLTYLESVRNWSPRVMSRLETMIRTADDYDLFRINPIQYATERSMAESEAIDLFLHAAKRGLFEIEWHLVCSCCGRIVESLHDMQNLHTHFFCFLCALSNDVAMDDYIQVTFTISTQIRDIVYRHPETLPVDDYYFKYELAKGVAMGPGAPKFDDFLRSRTKLLSYLAPQEKQRVEFDCVPGYLIGFDPVNNTSFTLFAQEPSAGNTQTISMQMKEGRFHSDHAFGTFHLDMVDGPHDFEQYGDMPTGKAVFEFDNLSSDRIAVWLVHMPPELVYRQPLAFDPFLSCKQLLTTQTFRDLFRSEIIQTSEGIAVRDITFLFTDLKGSTAMYDAIGDAKAYYLVRQHFDTLGKSITQNNGAIVKTIGDAVMATFMNPLDAVKAAIDMLKGVDAFNRNISQEIILKIGIHRGHSIVVTLDNRLDYFGQTVNIAARVQGLADAREIYVTDPTFNTPGMEKIVEQCEVGPEQVDLKGVSGKLKVHKITLTH